MHKKFLHGFVVGVCFISSMSFSSDSSERESKKRKAEKQISSSSHGKKTTVVGYAVNDEGHTPLHVLASSLSERTVEQVQQGVLHCARTGVPFSACVQNRSMADSEDVGLTAKELAEKKMTHALQTLLPAEYAYLPVGLTLQVFCDEYDKVYERRFLSWAVSQILHAKGLEKRLAPVVMAFIEERPRATKSPRATRSNATNNVKRYLVQKNLSRES